MIQVKRLLSGLLVLLPVLFLRQRTESQQLRTGHNLKHDVTGDLLLVSWIDRFGICQVAMDRGLLDEEHPGIDGVLVMMTGGMAL